MNTPSLILKAIVVATVAIVVNAGGAEPSVARTLLWADSTELSLPVDSTGVADSLADSVQLPPKPRLRLGGGVALTAANATVRPDPGAQAVLGAGADLRFEIEFMHPLYFIIGPRYQRRGLRQTIYERNGPEIEEEFVLKYLTIPFLWRIEAGPKPVTASIYVGADAGILLSAHRVTRIVGRSVTDTITDGLEVAELSFEAGLGYEHRTGSRHALFVDIRYTHGVTNILELSSINDDRRWWGRELTLTIGSLFTLQHGESYHRIEEPEPPEETIQIQQISR